MNGFDPDALETPLAPLDELPRGLWLPGIINSLGSLPRRLAGLTALREHLLAGELPGTHTPWPIPAALPLFLCQLEALQLPALCKLQEDVTDQVLKSLLWHTDRIIDYREEMDEAAALARAAQAFHGDWERMAAELRDVLFVFGDLGDAVKFNRWDATRGLLHSEGWQELVRIRRLLEDLGELRDIIRHLGRARQSDEPDFCNAPEVQVMERVTQAVTEWRDVRVPDLAAETEGIRRSNRIARMLPAEAMLLPHPRLRLIWFARHAERTLLTYEDQDVLREQVTRETESWRLRTRPLPQRKLEMGPIVLCVDTSGSMKGAAESVAKAVLLEAMRSAHAQRRACYVYAFSGPEEILERELPLDPGGIDNLIAFLTQGYNGGTDIAEPIGRALARIGDARWQFADLLIATDGEFGAPPATAQAVAKARETLGLRVQGVLIGDRETIGLRELCDNIYWLKDWRRFGAGGESPVHTQSLTALYFPNALR